MSGNYVRQLLFRARDQFVDHLLAEVAGALPEPTPEALEAELIDLSLLEQCRSGLDRYRRRHATP